MNEFQTRLRVSGGIKEVFVYIPMSISNWPIEVQAQFIKAEMEDQYKRNFPNPLCIPIILN